MVGRIGRPQNGYRRFFEHAVQEHLGAAGAEFAGARGPHPFVTTEQVLHLVEQQHRVVPSSAQALCELQIPESLLTTGFVDVVVGLANGKEVDRVVQR